MTGQGSRSFRYDRSMSAEAKSGQQISAFIIRSIAGCLRSWPHGYSHSGSPSSLSLATTTLLPKPMKCPRTLI
jgi:hypothetical protein